MFSKNNHVVLPVYRCTGRGLAVVVLLLLLLFFAGKGALLGQVQVGGERDEECRLKREDIQPMIQRDNPFFYDVRWDPDKKKESARMSEHRTVFIRQHGCLRHHRELTFIADPKVAEPENLGFYAVELFNMMNRIFYNDLNYWRYKLQFEQLFLERFPQYGLNETFDFQVAEYTFICEMEYVENIGATIHLDIINLVNKHKIRYPGVPRYEDDGFFVAPQPQN